MSAEVLRRAADLMEFRALAAQHADAKEPGRWMAEHHNSPFNRKPETCHIAEDRAGHYWTVASEVYIPNAEHMAGLDPFTALQIATLGFAPRLSASRRRPTTRGAARVKPSLSPAPTSGSPHDRLH